MVQIQIRPAIATDLPSLVKIDHSCPSDYVWQMDSVLSDGYCGATFREIRLPRTISTQYPRPPIRLLDESSKRAMLLVAVAEDGLAGYIRGTDKIAPQILSITDLCIIPLLRRKGIASALILAAQKWGIEQENGQVIIEMTSKNIAGINLAKKLGYKYCGYNDHYFVTQDVALFFCREIRNL